MIDLIEYWALVFSMIFLSITILFILVRAYLGPQFTDRVLSVSVINVKVIVLICVLAVLFDESYVIDIGILYALFGFLSVIVLARIYTEDHLKKQEKGDGES